MYQSARLNQYCRRACNDSGTCQGACVRARHGRALFAAAGIASAHRHAHIDLVLQHRLERLHHMAQLFVCVVVDRFRDLHARRVSALSRCARHQGACSETLAQTCTLLMSLQCFALLRAHF